MAPIPFLSEHFMHTFDTFGLAKLQQVLIDYRT